MFDVRKIVEENMNLLNQFSNINFNEYKIKNLNDICKLYQLKNKLAYFVSKELLSDFEGINASLAETFSTKKLLEDYNVKYSKINNEFKKLSKTEKDKEFNKLKNINQNIEINNYNLENLSPQQLLKQINSLVKNNTLNYKITEYISQINYLPLTKSMTYMQLDEIKVFYSSMYSQLISIENKENLTKNFSLAIREILMKRGYITKDFQNNEALLKEINAFLLNNSNYEKEGLSELIAKQNYDISKKAFEKETIFAKLKNHHTKSPELGEKNAGKIR